MIRPPLAWLLASLFVPVSLAGCGGEAIHRINVDGDSKKISEAVEAFNEFSMDARRTAGLFAADRMPKGDAFKKYRRYAYFPTGEAKVSGDGATMAISLREEKTSNDLGTVEWTFKKDGDAWKIAAAPLP